MEPEKLHFEQCPGDCAHLRGLGKEQAPPSCFTRASGSLLWPVPKEALQTSTELLQHGARAPLETLACARGEASGHAISSLTAMHIHSRFPLLLSPRG